MDPSAYPAPPSACGGPFDPSAATTAECGAAMQALCGQVTLYEGNAMPDLINPSSNCAAWRSAILVQNVLAGSLSGGSAFLDAAAAAYCAAEPTDAACQCLAFPTNVHAQGFCHGDCAAPPGQCSTDEIAQVTADGRVSVLQFFNGCTPHFCWLQSCFDSNGLVPTGIVVSQTVPGFCPPWCAMVESKDSYNNSSGTPPMPPGSWVAQGGGLISQCGATAVGPTPFLEELTYLWSANSQMQQSLVMSNMGDLPLILSVSHIDVPWAVVEPAANFFVPGRTMELMLLTADQPTLAAAQASAPGGVLQTQTTIEFTYPDSEGVTQTYTSTQHFSIGAAHPPVKRERAVVPSWFYGVAVGAAVLALWLLVSARSDRKYVHTFLRQHHLTHAATG